MLASLLLGAVAGFATRTAEPWAADLLGRVFGPAARPGPGDLRLLTFGALLLLAAVVVAALGADASLFLAGTGALAGHFAPQIRAFLRDPDRAMADPADDWDGTVEGPRRRMREAEPPAPEDTDAATLAAVRRRLSGEEGP